MGKYRHDFVNLEVYNLAEQLSDEIWQIVQKWNSLAQFTIGKQIITASDSVGANIAEGTGRGSYPDNRRFVRMARGSLYETRHWLRRAHKRGLLKPEQVDRLKSIIEKLAPKLNAYLNSIGSTRTNKSVTANDK